jgi:hypothetical protein
MMEDDTLYDDNFEEDIPYVSLDLGIEDVRLICESIAEQQKLCHHDDSKKENLKYLENFLQRVILEYSFRVE